MAQTEKNFLRNRLWRALQDFTVLSFGLLFMLCFFYLLELLLYAFTHGLPDGFFGVLVNGLFRVFLFWLEWLLISWAIFTVIHLASRYWARTLYLVYSGIILLIQFFLVQYYNTSLALLGGDLFGYSWDEIVQTVGASGAILTAVIGFLVIVALIYFGLKWLIPRVRVSVYLGAALLAGSFLLFIMGFTTDDFKTPMDSAFASDVVTNKSSYFYSSSYNYFNPTPIERDIYADNYFRPVLEEGEQSEVIIPKYIGGDEYPFLRETMDRDVLSPFFRPVDSLAQPPHVVVVIVEGLGRAYSNNDTYLGSFTPFLDSLSRKSLYWKNGLSNGGRTFAVLPSLLGSLPYAENGFLATASLMPNHLSLLNVLKTNGYKTSFFYGSDARFDNMQDMLRKNNIDRISDEDNFPSGYSRMPENNGFSWGYGDRDLFKYYLSQLSRDTLRQPELNVLLTVSMHSPFLIPNQSKYLKMVDERMNTLGFSQDKLNQYNPYRKQLSTVMYTDESVKEFITAYQSNPSFENTVFIITGDHRIPEIPMSTKIDRYHVPIMIYSPMLERSATFRSISTHADIAPSMINYLAGSYDLDKPAYNHFIGIGMDTARQFRNIHKMGLKQTKTNLIDFIYEDYHLNGDQLFALDGNMYESPINDEDLKATIKANFQEFQRRNTLTIGKRALLPDSIYNKFSGR